MLEGASFFFFKFRTGMKSGVHAHWGLNLGLMSQCEFGRFWQTLSSMQSPPMTIN